MATWTHPELGDFENPDGHDWQQSRMLAEFDVFANVFGDQTVVLPPTYSDETDEPGPPAPDVVSLAVLVLGQLSELLEDGVQALWHDLTGSGPVRSGMWWHGDIAHAFEGIDSPSGKADLYEILEPRSVTLSSGYASTPPRARIQFDAAFEEEHGVSFLTDGAAVIGVGYAYDSSPFRLK